MEQCTCIAEVSVQIPSKPERLLNPLMFGSCFASASVAFKTVTTTSKFVNHLPPETVAEGTVGELSFTGKTKKVLEL